MTKHDAQIQDGKVVLTPEQAAESGLREGNALMVISSLLRLKPERREQTVPFRRI